MPADSEVSTARNVLVAIVVFFAAHFALPVGVSAPCWLLWAFVAVALAGFAAMLPISAGFVGTSRQTFSRLMLFQNWI